jgi:hypothetical protein
MQKTSKDFYLIMGLIFIAKMESSTTVRSVKHLQTKFYEILIEYFYINIFSALECCAFLCRFDI